MPCMTGRLDLDQRLELTRMLMYARQQRGWSQAILAERAEEALREAAETFQCSAEERAAWLDLTIEIADVAALENFPARPLINAKRRGKLLGVALALGLDLAVVNRKAGGL